MPRYVGFLRAVNVGRRQAPMARVRAALEAGGFSEVQTYIQTGNVLVTSAARSSQRVAHQIEQVLTAEFGFEVPTIVRMPSDLPALVAAVDALPNPFPDGRTYAAFLASEPDAEGRALLDAWDAPGEWARVVGRHVVMRLGVPAHASTLTNAKIERHCGRATTRDLTVVRALADRWGG
ncbi:MAG: DUF1697 domain-containing protein [Candidatus Phosphoribacter baldrii]